MKAKISHSYFLVAALALVLTPFFAHAQFGSFFLNILEFVKTVIKALFPIVTAVLILLFGYQLVMFLWGTKEKPEEHEVFRRRMIHSLIAVFVWFVLFGLITTVANSLGLGVGNDVGSQDITSVILTP